MFSFSIACSRRPFMAIGPGGQNCQAAQAVCCATGPLPKARALLEVNHWLSGLFYLQCLTENETLPFICFIILAVIDVCYGLLMGLFKITFRNLSIAAPH